MTIQISLATPSDATPISTLHISAFNVNPLLHVQFPTPSSRQSLQRFLALEILRDLGDPGRAVVVARDAEGEENMVVGFASWALPGAVEGDGEKEKEWPLDCRREWLEKYYDKVVEARKRVVGERECYGKGSDYSAVILNRQRSTAF
jgi:hypothetical protein